MKAQNCALFSVAHTGCYIFPWLTARGGVTPIALWPYLWLHLVNSQNGAVNRAVLKYQFWNTTAIQSTARLQCTMGWSGEGQIAENAWSMANHWKELVKVWTHGHAYLWLESLGVTPTLDSTWTTPYPHMVYAWEFSISLPAGVTCAYTHVGLCISVVQHSLSWLFPRAKLFLLWYQGLLLYCFDSLVGASALKSDGYGQRAKFSLVTGIT